MQTYAFVFSPTGGTRRVCDLLCSPWPSATVYDLFANDTLPSTLDADDVCFFCVPSYGGRVPELAIQRLQKLSGHQARAILVCVYGNRDYEDTLLELKDLLAQNDFRCCAAISAIAEHSIMHQFATGRPDAQDITALTDYSNRIQTALQQGTLSDDVSVPGHRPYRSYGGVPLKPHASNQCTECGLCACECPVHAIDAACPRSTDTSLCISCMHCISICPQNARHLNRLMLLAASKKLQSACQTRKENELFL